MPEKLDRETTHKVLLALVEEYLVGVDSGPGWAEADAMNIEETANDFEVYLADTDWAGVLKEVK